jgi:P-type E1-E2 ATPase
MEGSTILGAILIIVSVASGNNYVKELQFRKLNAKREEYDVLVTRDEAVKLIKVRNLLVGDILHLNIGDMLTVDGILIEGSEIQMDESAMTG